MEDNQCLDSDFAILDMDQNLDSGTGTMNSGAWMLSSEGIQAENERPAKNTERLKTHSKLPVKKRTRRRKASISNRLCAFPSLDQNDSLIFVPTRLIKCINAGDVHGIYGLLRMNMAPDCTAILPLGSIFGHPLLISRVLNLAMTSNPDTIMLAPENRIEGNKITAKIIGKLTDSCQIMKNMQNMHFHSNKRYISEQVLATASNMSKSNNIHCSSSNADSPIINGNSESASSASSTSSVASAESRDESCSSTCTGTGTGTGTRPAVHAYTGRLAQVQGVSARTTQQQQQQQQQQQSSKHPSFQQGQAAANDDTSSEQRVASNEKALAYISRDILGSRVMKFLSRMDLSSKTADERGRLLEIASSEADLTIHFSGHISITVDEKSQKITHFEKVIQIDDMQVKNS